ncbi:MAG: hypothetical protein IPM61_01900 [Chlorobi bacterium]|nr:hypothetical protein [Chlorobiota bacterium]MBX7217508.1 hypothetical protein [Candidatus Kapabacteria bacterium]
MMKNICTIGRLRIAALLLLWTPAVASAQGSVVGFSAAGKQHLLRVAGVRAGLLKPVREAAIASLEAYAKLCGPSWEMPTLFIDLVEEKADEDLPEIEALRDREAELPATTDGAVAAREEADVCRITLRRHPSGHEEYSQGSTRYLITHAVAQGVQQFNQHDVAEEGASTIERSKWYTSGIADWMASKVYELPQWGERLPKIQIGFAAALGKPITEMGPHTYFFWSFLESQGSKPLEVLRGMPMDPDEHQEYLRKLFPNLQDLMIRFAVAISKRTLSPLPDHGSIWRKNEYEYTMPRAGTAVLETAPIAVSFHTITVQEIPEGGVVMVTPANLATSQSWAALGDGTVLRDGETVRICAKDIEQVVRVMVARGNADDPEEYPQISVALDTAPCPHKAAPPKPAPTPAPPPKKKKKKK